MSVRILPITPESYARHPLHGEERAWAETNCYVDLWIELLHAFGLDPVASLGFTLTTDFEGDQWTMFKPSLGDFYTLYGVDVRELNVWKPIVEHALEHVGQGRPLLVELDSYFLPDTAGVSYRTEHIKSMIAIQAIDPQSRTLEYFHNAGYFRLEGEDFDGLFRLGDFAPKQPALAPYTEFARFEHIVHRSPGDLRALSVKLMKHHLERRPRHNPVARFRPRFASDLTWLRDQPIERFHQYAFATLRQAGAAAELASTYFQWLSRLGEPDLESVITAFDTISNSSKAIQFKVARSVATKKPLDVDATLDGMEAAWDTAMALLVPRYGV